VRFAVESREPPFSKKRPKKCTAMAQRDSTNAQMGGGSMAKKKEDFKGSIGQSSGNDGGRD